MFKKKSLITLVSLLAILCVTVSGSLAFLIDTDGPITNLFNPSEVTTEVIEDLNGTTKQNVKIKNTGDTDAYIRAAVVVTWQDADGNVYGAAPKATDYTLNIITTDQENPDGKWTKGADGFYYWSKPVAPNATTNILIQTCSVKNGAQIPDGYNLAVEIIGSGVQAKGMSSDNKAPVVEAWGLDNGGSVMGVSDGSLTIKTN